MLQPWIGKDLVFNVEVKKFTTVARKAELVEEERKEMGEMFDYWGVGPSKFVWNFALSHAFQAALEEQ